MGQQRRGQPATEGIPFGAWFQFGLGTFVWIMLQIASDLRLTPLLGVAVFLAIGSTMLAVMIAGRSQRLTQIQRRSDPGERTNEGHDV
jgi:hypothetical protein